MQDNELEFYLADECIKKIWYTYKMEKDENLVICDKIPKAAITNLDGLS